MGERLQALDALGPGPTLKRAVDQVAALFCAEIYEELTDRRSGWSPDEYAVADKRLLEVLLGAGREPHSSS
jgi:hypothetical protein